MQKRKQRKAFSISNYSKEIFVGTIIVGYLIYALAFLIGPMVFSLVISLFSWSVVNTPTFVGLDNFKRLFTQEPTFYKALWNTLRYTVINVPISIITSLFFAVILNSAKVFKSFFRTAYFVPYVTSLVACSVVWNWLYQPTFGLFNQIILAFGGTRVAWLTSIETALWAVMAMNIWKATGYRIVIFMGALQSLPESLNEAARIDGANRFQVFFRIQLPQLIPVVGFVSMITTVGCVNIFEPIAMMTSGGPLDSTTTIVYLLYDRAFNGLQMGYGSAIAVVLLVIIITLTVLQNKILARFQD